MELPNCAFPEICPEPDAPLDVDKFMLDRGAPYMTPAQQAAAEAEWLRWERHIAAKGCPHYAVAIVRPDNGGPEDHTHACQLHVGGMIGYRPDLDPESYIVTPLVGDEAQSYWCCFGGLGRGGTREPRGGGASRAVEAVEAKAATTIAAGLPLASAALAKPPLVIPGDDGQPYKTELVTVRSPERTVKINWWHAPDASGDRARPHNHPWDFTSTVLHGAITHTRYLSGVGGTPPSPRILDSTETIRAGESYTVRASEYHLVTAVEPGTVTRMECGPIGGTEPPGESWGYLDVVTGEHVPATPDPEFRARLAAANPWMRSS